MALVGKKFPNVTVDAISKSGENQRINILDEAVNKQTKVLLFWYPKDFTFVCPTELHAFQAALEEFKNRNTIVIEGVSYPLLADTHRQLANILGIVDQEFEYDEEGNEVFTGSNVTYRATYLIDEEGKIFHESVNDMPLGRNVAEYLRLIDAYTHVQKYGEVCPANWQEGKDAMHADRSSTAAYLSSH